MSTNGVFLTQTARGVSTGPGAFATIASVTLSPFTTYEFVVELYFSGTAPVDGTDNDNFFIEVDATFNGPLAIPAVAGVLKQSRFIGMTGTGGVASVTTSTAGTAGTKYHAAITANPVPQAVNVSPTM